MKIALDANEANIENRVGTGQYTYNILTNWHKNTSHTFDLYLRDKPVPSMPRPSDNWKYHVIGPKKAWTRFALPLNLALDRVNNYDVFWNPAHYLPSYTPCKSVVTIHDLAYEYFPELFLKEDLYKLKNWTQKSVKKADKVIAVSESTKNDLINLYGLEKNKISVVYNGYDKSLFNSTDKVNSQIPKTYGLKPKTYLLFVSTIQPRKNVIKLVQAFRLLKEEGYKGKLVIAGKVGWMAEESLSVIKNSPDHKDIVMTGYISDEVRQALHRYSDVHVLPSLYEGFGVSVLEAMASGVPVAASNNSSLPEVVGKAGLLFNPIDPADIARAVWELKKNRSSWVKKSLAQAKKFSWEKCAKETLKVVIKLGGSNEK